STIASRRSGGKHGFDAFKVISIYGEVVGDILNDSHLRLTDGSVGIGNIKQEVQNLKPHFISGARTHSRRNSTCIEMLFFNDFVKRSESGISTCFAVGLCEISADIIELLLASRAICFND